MKQKTNISVRNNLGYHITSEMELGPNNGYSSGDLLDANATAELINNKVDAVVDGASSTMDTLKEVETEISDLPTIRTSIENIQSLISADSQDID
jgi:hypothetical protein